MDIILCSPSYNTGAIRENENNKKKKKNVETHSSLSPSKGAVCERCL